MKTFLIATSISIICSISFFDLPTFNYDEEVDKDAFAIVQLFTSQGCSSCPSADILLEKVKKEYAEENVVVLSYHVDYWNRLGWKDPFSKKEFTLLQNAYGFAFNSNRIYTPQAVINGEIHFVGSNESKMNGHLSKFLKKSVKNTIQISDLEVSLNKVNFKYNIQGSRLDKELKVALVLEKRETPVKRGENGGKLLKNSNIVLEEITIHLKNKKGIAEIEIPSIVKKEDNLQIVGYLQKSDFEITGATQSETFNLH